jgi:hydroxybutyrate-dimer hydrolase
MNDDLRRLRLRHATAAIAGCAILLAGCGSSDDDGDFPGNDTPGFLVGYTRAAYDGASDDLLTAGLGKSGLGGTTAPGFANPTAPTAAELRRSAIWWNYRAIVDVNPNGGYGTLYGPNIDANGQDALGEGKVAGVEYLGYADDDTGTKNVTLLVQIPNNWNRGRPCIVTGTSSGSRGVYGAIGSSGEWGLKRGCAVAYADKGTGNGVHDLATDTVNLIDGTRATSTAAGRGSNFTSITGSALATFNAASPNRVAVKHAHSQQNPEKDWGAHTLYAIQFAIFALNQEYNQLTPDGIIQAVFNGTNTVVIAASVSNGAGAALAAAEQDDQNLIDGIAVSEPNVALPANPALRVVRGSRVLVGAGRPLYDYFTYANLLQPCAALSANAAGSPGANLVGTATATNRCASLKAKGVLTSATTADQANEALALLLDYGWDPETTKLHASHYALATPAIAMTYANSYSRSSVSENLCGFSFAGVDSAGKPAPLAATALAQIFGNGNGVPPTAGIQIVNNLSVGGPVRDGISVSPSTGVQDYNVDGALCQRNLWTGADAAATNLRSGVNATLRNANLRGKPALIVHGRSDTLVPPAFTSRPYFGQNRIAEGSGSRLSYVEVTNAQHFDAFIDSPALPGYDSMFVPLHYYFNQALDLMFAHLTAGGPLPPSQLVRTTPRGGTPGAAPPITKANVPPILANPAASNLITFADNTVTIPD